MESVSESKVESGLELELELESESQLVLALKSELESD